MTCLTRSQLQETVTSIGCRRLLVGVAWCEFRACYNNVIAVSGERHCDRCGDLFAAGLWLLHDTTQRVHPGMRVFSNRWQVLLQSEARVCLQLYLSGFVRLRVSAGLACVGRLSVPWWESVVDVVAHAYLHMPTPSRHALVDPPLAA